VKDSVKATTKPPAATTAVKDSIRDSSRKYLVAAPKPTEVKEVPKDKAPATEHRDTPTVMKKTEDKPEPKAPPKKEDAPEKKPAAEPTSTDEYLYKAAMVYQQQGDLNEAISRYKHLSESSGRYGELSRYQLAVCYRSKGQTGKARRMFKEVVRMNGSMKEKAQAALDNL
jgi:tetratricopeptide (TPR) repeat protein